MSEEKVFIDERGVLVTNTRVVTPIGDTYSLSNVTSCKSRYTEHEGTDKKKGRIKQLLFIGGIVLGIILWIYFGWKVGIAVAAIGIIASLFINASFKFRRYQVFLGSASGESQAIEDSDEEFILRVVDAINRAIISRG
jgi:hypothetical protein